MMGRALLLALFWLLAGTAQSAVATFQGEALEDLTGLRTDRLEVAAYRDGELRSVPEPMVRACYAGRRTHDCSALPRCCSAMRGFASAASGC